MRNKILQANTTNGGWRASDLGLDNSYILVNGRGSIYDAGSSVGVRSGFEVDFAGTYGVDGVYSHQFYISAVSNNLQVGTNYKLSGDIFCIKINSFKTLDIQ